MRIPPLTGDVNFGNDSTTGYIVQNNTINSYPNVEDFETFSTGAPGTFANGWVRDQTTSVPRWQVQANGTGSTGTGPSGNHTAGGSIYVYMETSGGTLGDSTWMISPCYDLTAATFPGLEFWYHMYGATMGTLSLDVYANGMWNNNVWSLSGQQQTGNSSPWLKQVVNLGQWASATDVQFRFVGGTRIELYR